MTSEEIKAVLIKLPSETTRLLALGPIGDDEGIRGCRICDTFAATIDPRNLPMVVTSNMLLDYHDIDGSQGPRCYQRCLEIYRAAGWVG